MTFSRIALVVAIFWIGVSGPIRAEERAVSVCDRFAGTSQTSPSPETVEGATASFLYKTAGAASLRVHVFNPEGAVPAPRPTVIFFFGGGWMTGSVSAFAPQARHLAARGVTAILADYRTFCRNGVEVDAQVTDAADAVRWVRAHAKELEIDPGRIAVSGGSAGGHLALSSAIFGQPDSAGTSPMPDLLVLFYPCVDLTSDVEKEFSSEAIAGHGEKLSPLFHVRAGLPKTFIFQGTADPLHGDVLAYCSRARNAGNQCELTEYPGAAHGFFNASSPTRGKWYDTALVAMVDVLTGEGWLPRAVSLQ